MPPVTRIGVIATARSPTSTLRRATSKKLVRVAKFGANAVNAAISSAIAAATIAPGALRCTATRDRIAHDPPEATTVTKGTKELRTRLTVVFIVSFAVNEANELEPVDARASHRSSPRQE